VITTRHPRLLHAGQYAALACYMIFLAIPLLWLLSVSFKGPRELVELHPSFIPSRPTLDNYNIALHENDLVHAGVNSLKVAVLTALVTTGVGLPAAYVLARTRGLVARAGLVWILLSQMFPTILIIIPLFLVLRDLHLTNSHTGLILVYLVWALPFILWMLQSYIRGIPRDLEEAAAVDGATRLQIVVRVIAPLLAPASSSRCCSRSSPPGTSFSSRSSCSRARASSRSRSSSPSSSESKGSSGSDRSRPRRCSRRCRASCSSRSCSAG